MSDEKKHGPHGPDCHCDHEDELATVANGMARVLEELMPGLVQAWENGEPGMTIDFLFDRGNEEFAGIAVRAKVLEDVDWPGMPDIETLAKITTEDSEGYMRWSAGDPLTPPPGENGNGIVH